MSTEMSNKMFFCAHLDTICLFGGTEMCRNHFKFHKLLFIQKY